MSTSTPKLFQPIRVGGLDLLHRVVLSPMSRFRADAQHVPGTLAIEYYKQRTSVPGTLAITEGTFVALRAGGLANIPGIWNDEQIAAWKPIVDAVHKNGSFIFLQLLAAGRCATASVLKEEGEYPLVSASDIPLKDKDIPRPLTIEEIKEYVQLFATAAENAVAKAGFDGVEIQAANGCLIDQFLQTVSNTRTDEYGGSVENRVRFGLEIVDAVVKAVGASKVGVKVSPWMTYQGMGMPDPVPTFTELVIRIRELYPDFAYIHVLDPDVSSKQENAEESDTPPSSEFLRDIWGNRAFIANYGFERDTAIERVENEGGLVSFGRHFISNPDLPYRLKKNIALAPYDFKTFYTPGALGYTDYPAASA